jgi:hypothetical protein
MPTPTTPTAALSQRATQHRVPHLRRSFIAPKVGIYMVPRPALVVASAAAFAVVVAFAFVCHSERSEEPPHFAFAVAVAVASGYPKALALGLSSKRNKRGFSPWGKPSYPSHLLRNITLARVPHLRDAKMGFAAILILTLILPLTACSPRKPVPDPKPIPKPIPKTITSTR